MGFGHREYKVKDPRAVILQSLAEELFARFGHDELYDVAHASSNFKTKIADILKNEGFIKDFKINDTDKKPTLSLELKYHSGNPVISAFERVSKPGRRIFSSAEGLPKINNGLGIAIVSTPKGVMTDIDARKQRVGGEIICKVF